MRATRITTVAALAALAVPLFPAAAWAAPVTTCGQTISKPGSYALTDDLDCETTAIFIRSNGVRLALNGYSIGGPGSEDMLADGIDIGTGRTGVLGLVITGPGEITRFGTGIHSSGLRASKIDGLTLNENGFGLIVSASDEAPATANVFSDLYVGDSDITGVMYNGVTRSVFSGNYVANNGGNGLEIYWGSRNVVRDNDFQDNGIGIRVQEGFTEHNVITDNDAFDSYDWDLYDGNDEPVNTWHGNLFEMANQDYIA